MACRIPEPLPRTRAIWRIPLLPFHFREGETRVRLVSSPPPLPFPLPKILSQNAFFGLVPLAVSLGGATARRNWFYDLKLFRSATSSEFECLLNFTVSATRWLSTSAPAERAVEGDFRRNATALQQVTFRSQRSQNSKFDRYEKQFLNQNIFPFLMQSCLKSMQYFVCDSPIIMYVSCHK